MLLSQQTRTGFTLVETLVVMAIIGFILAMVLSVLHSSVVGARVKECQNNRHQIQIARYHFQSNYKKVKAPPLVATKGLVSGWSYELLPYLEEKAVFDPLKRNMPLIDAPKFASKRPKVMSCPLNSANKSTLFDFEAAHFSRHTVNESFSDASFNEIRPWLCVYDFTPTDTFKPDEFPHAEYE
jgi:prepilin-type N-terminal cleavage/methylation domain-containing protein